MRFPCLQGWDSEIFCAIDGQTIDNQYMENNGYKCDKRYVRGIKINCGDDGNEINDELDG